ncbi:MAG: toll/interleukin-1 receptor domain-containing protein [Proteobacteria bacterium]|nr:toll/interleukin-1 receptor domain-containing protein [Pseudomonadota bacterium]
MKVFLSYRRADSQVSAGRMAQFLDAVSAVDAVFLDVDGIAPGENFETKIQDTLTQVDHVFLIIGAQWAGPAGNGGRARIFDDDDMVRRETRLALASRAKVVPILLDEASMPRPGDLPADLKALPSINAFSLRTAHFDEDMDDLLDALLGNKQGRSSRWRDAPLTLAGAAWRTAAGLLGAAALMIGLGLANRWADDGCYDLVCRLHVMFGLDDQDALGLLWLIGLLVLGLGALAPFAPRWLRRKHR